MTELVVVPELPAGYTLIVYDPGRGWRSFGWRLELLEGLVVRMGSSSSSMAAATAWAHHREISPG